MRTKAECHSLVCGVTRTLIGGNDKRSLESVVSATWTSYSAFRIRLSLPLDTSVSAR